MVFDIDGTLTRTVDLDTEAYAAAFRRTFGAELPALDWASYRNATESGVATEAATVVLGRSPAPRELDAMRDEFNDLLREAMAGLPPAELEMPGAGRLLQRLADEGHHVALATGCWRRSAEAKLRGTSPASRWRLPKMPSSARSSCPSRLPELVTIPRVGTSTWATASGTCALRRPSDGSSSASGLLAAGSNSTG